MPQLLTVFTIFKKKSSDSFKVVVILIIMNISKHIYFSVSSNTTTISLAKLFRQILTEMYMCIFGDRNLI